VSNVLVMSCFNQQFQLNGPLKMGEQTLGWIEIPRHKGHNLIEPFLKIVDS